RLPVSHVAALEGNLARDSSAPRLCIFFFSSRRRHTRSLRDWSSDVCSSDLEEADADRLWHLSASKDEFLALCGTAGLGRIALLEPDTVIKRLHELASDPRWRVREGVAIALQRIGREDMPGLLVVMKGWAGDEPFVQRAV